MSESYKSSEFLDPRLHFEIIQRSKELVEILKEKDRVQGNISTLHILFDSLGEPIEAKRVVELDADMPKGWVGKYFNLFEDRLRIVAPLDNDDPDKVIRLRTFQVINGEMLHSKTLIYLTEQTPVKSDTMPCYAPVDAIALSNIDAMNLLADLEEITAAQQ